MAQSIAEIWARGVNEKTSPKPKTENVQIQTTPVKPVVDKATESRKARFRQNILNTNNKEKSNGQA